jgi:hypothetical protein
MASKKAYVLGGYQIYAAGRMLYHVAHVLGERFGYEPIVVRAGNESFAASPFRYPKEYRMIDQQSFYSTVGQEDIFLPVAATWGAAFGLTLNCRKLLYVQGVNTYKVLDGFMDGYVSVSTFVQKVLAQQYAIHSPVINPFIDLADMPSPLEWTKRDPNEVVIFVKPPELADPLVRAFTARLALRHPAIRASFRVFQRGVPHSELMALLGRTRFVVALSPIEGFGLVPLEAMAMGCSVVAFHGGGGLDYMTDDNSRNVGYPALDTLVDQFAAVFGNEALAAALADRGRADAQRFTLKRFEDSWARLLGEFGV